MGEAVGRFGVGFAFALFEFGDRGFAVAGDDEGGADAFEFESSQIVIVFAEVGGESVFLEKRPPRG